MTQTSIAVWADRHLEPQLVAEVAKYLEGSGVADGVLLADQTTNFLPQQLWTAANTPMAQVMDDPDSHSDVWVIAGYLLAHAPSLGLTVSTDAVRHAPAELVQRMLTLANLTAGRAAFHIGGGEAKQCEPFGHKRSQGMSRMEDLFKIFHLLLDADRPVDFEGRRWTFKRAWIGNARLPWAPRAT
jgi:phthiodiolone/phenolphthiodiolone dimycocerosates ketoreductase